MLFEKKVKCNTQVAESWKREEEDVQVYKLNRLLDKIEKKITTQPLVSKQTLEDWKREVNAAERSMKSGNTFFYTESTRLMPVENQITNSRNTLDEMLGFIEQQSKLTTSNNKHYPPKSSVSQSDESLLNDNISLANVAQETTAKTLVREDRLFMETCAGQTDVIINVNAIKKTCRKQDISFKEMMDFLVEQEKSCFPCLPCNFL